MGIGYLGEVRRGPDGNLYQWVEGTDGLGNPIGFWKSLRRRLRRVVRRALPIVKQVAPFIPGGAAVTTALTTATPLLRRAGVAGYGELYRAPDGTLYGLSQEEDQAGLGQDEIDTMGAGVPGEVRQGIDGHLYQWVEGVDGLGNPIGFWRRLRRGLRRIAKRALPIIRQVAPLVPGGAAVTTALTRATPFLRRAGIAGAGLGQLYQAPDGSLYEFQGALSNAATQDELEGLEQDEQIDGLENEEDSDVQGLNQDEELMGLGNDEELDGLEADEELEGLQQGYVRENGATVGAYVPQAAATTPWFKAPAQPPEMWKPLW
jgi:hypothetical protein